MSTSDQEERLEPAVDLRRLQETSEGDRAFEEELLGVFLEDCAKRLLRLEEAIGAGDTEQRTREAHAMKGAGVNIGATRMGRLADEIEQMGTENGAEAATALCAALKEEFEEVKRFLRGYLAS